VNLGERRAVGKDPYGGKTRTGCHAAMSLGISRLPSARTYTHEVSYRDAQGSDRIVPVLALARYFCNAFSGDALSATT
jgi:hypothetical protein